MASSNNNYNKAGLNVFATDGLIGNFDKEFNHIILKKDGDINKICELVEEYLHKLPEDVILRVVLSAGSLSISLKEFFDRYGKLLKECLLKNFSVLIDYYIIRFLKPVQHLKFLSKYLLFTQKLHMVMVYGHIRCGNPSVDTKNLLQFRRLRV